MIRNVGRVDRAVRLLLGIATLVFVLSGFVSGVTTAVLVIVGTFTLVSGVIGSCPTYRLLRINTKRNTNKI